MIWSFYRVHTHFAYIFASATASTNVSINVHFHKTDFVKQTIKSAKRAEILAKWSVNNNAYKNNDSQNAGFPGKNTSKDFKQ